MSLRFHSLSPAQPLAPAAAAQRVICATSSPAMQPACTAVADAMDTEFLKCLRGTRSNEPTAEDLALAGQKAAFVRTVEACAHEAGRPLDWACMIIASRAAGEGLFPLLHTAGKRGGSLLESSAAWHNFRQWRTKLGRREDGSTNVDNKVALVRSYKGSKKFTPKGPLDFYVEIFRVVLHQNNVTLSCAYRRVKAFWMHRDPAIAPQLPSYDQVNWVYRHLDRKMVDMARSPERKWINSHRPYTECKAQAPGAIWVGDNHHLDFWVIDEDTGNVGRPWLTLWEDYGAFAPVGWHLRLADPDRDAVILALRDAVIRSNGHCATFLKIDNGKDYTCQEMQQTVARLGIECSNALPFNPQAKPVERMNAKIAVDFSTWFFSYCGNKPENRPDNAEWARTHPESLPTIKGTRIAFEAWAKEHMSIPSRAKGCDGRTPAEVMAGVVYGTERLNARDISEVFAQSVGTRTINRGEVAVDRVKYYSQALYDLYMNVKAVHVRIDRDDRDLAYIFDENGAKLGEARRKIEHDPMLVHNATTPPESLEAYRQEMKGKARATKDLKDALRTLTGQKRGQKRAAIALPEHMVQDVQQVIRNITRPAPAPQPRYSTPEIEADLVEALNEQTTANRAILEAEFSIDNP